MSLDTESKHSQPPGMLRIPIDRASTAIRRTVVEHLRGHVTSEAWLPADTTWPELAELREEQLRHRDQVAVQLDALSALSAVFYKEDAAKAEALRQSYRDGSGKDVDDDRTSPEDRALQVAEVEERLYAAVEVMAEFIVRALNTIRQNEEKWLADLQGDLGRAREKREEAQRLLRQASIAEWAVHRLGAWLLNTSDDGPLARQPAPKPDVPAPRDFSKSKIERPWHRTMPGVTAPTPPVIEPGVDDDEEELADVSKDEFQVSKLGGAS